MRKNMANIPDFGTLVDAATAEMLDQDDLPKIAPDALPQDPNNPLWEYITFGTIDGYKVADEAQGLPIESVEQLQAVLVPKLSPASEILVISADDPKGIERYNELRKMEADKQIVITSEASQYDTARSAYITWIKYSHVEYKLAPRYAYLKEE